MGPGAGFRPMSPDSARMLDPMRASTGTVPITAYDPYNSSARQGYAGYATDVPYVASSYDPRFVRDPRLEAQPISSKAYHDHGHSTRRTEYAIRPRQRSSTTSVADTHHDSLHPYSRASPVITTGYHHRSPSPLRGQERYLVPASSSRHHRHYHPSHPGYGSDTGRLDPNDRARSARMSHGGYRGYGHHGHGRYPSSGGFRNGDDIDSYDAYTYTNPREQFENDSDARLRYHRSGYRRERPLSLTGVDDHHLHPKREPRALGPPPSQRGFDKIDRSHRLTYGSGDSDIDLASGRRRPRHHTPVSLHQDHDEGYSSYRDDHDDSRHRSRRHRHRRSDHEGSSRQPHDDRSPRTSTPKEPTGLGTAGLASGYSDDFNYELSPRSDRHHSHNHDDRKYSSRPRRPSRRRVGSDSDAYSSDDLKKYRQEPSARVSPNGSDASLSSGDRPSHYLTVERPRRQRSHSRRRPEESPSSKQFSPQESPSPQSDPKKSELRVTKDADVQPKGILKTPKDKFPEEPNPVREGVAPLKDAHPKGIPPGARWTKIDRRLVNPAALEAGHERFEERPEHVIVLRVLSKEDIQAYAIKTQEIRDARQHKYIQEKRRRREEDRRRGRVTDDFSSDDEDEADSPLAIEGPAESKSTPKPTSQAAQPAELAA